MTAMTVFAKSLLTRSRSSMDYPEAGPIKSHFLGNAMKNLRLDSLVILGSKIFPSLDLVCGYLLFSLHWGNQDKLVSNKLFCADVVLKDRHILPISYLAIL